MHAEKELTPEQLAQVNCAYWTHLYRIRLQSGEFTYKDHEYLREPMESHEQVEVTMKATQAGFTESEVLRNLHGCIYGHLPQGSLYLFPTDDDVIEFSKVRFNTLIQNNADSIGKFVKSGGKGTDSASLKKIGNSFIYFRSGKQNKIIGSGDAKEASQLRSIPVDNITYDEYDLMDEDICEKARGRLGHSKIKMERYLSNPTVPGYGIDKLFQKSDQRHWFRKCQACGEWTCAELEFPQCVKLDTETRKGYIACIKCGKPVQIYPGKWIAAHPGAEMIGRRWSQLTSSFNDPYKILMDYENPRDGNRGDVIRLRLGLPHVDIEDKLRIQDVHECLGDDVPLERHAGPCAMGVDVGKIKHVVIGNRIGSDRYEIIRTTTVSTFSEVHDLARRYGVRVACIDIRPYEDEARAFQKAEPYRVFLCEYSDNAMFEKTLNEKTGVIKAHRTGIFDKTHKLFTEKRLILPRRCRETDEFCKQCCNTAKRMETNKKTNTQVYRYVPLGPEHYRNALNYFYLAACGGKISVTRPSGVRVEQREMVADNNYVRC